MIEFSNIFNHNNIKIFLLTLQYLTGYFLFSTKKLLRNKKYNYKGEKISCIIPARNEEKNLPILLESLKKQSIKPYEIIVVDDNSSDRTGDIALEYGAILVKNGEPPENWTGKVWALWNGYLKSTGDILIFLDADVRLQKDAISTLLYLREKNKGVISVFPYHYTERFYEKFAILFNILGSFTFTSPFEKNKGDMCGAVIVARREDYEKVDGHRSVSSDVVEDFSLGRVFEENGIPADTYLGYKTISFRMYPDGLKSLIEGFTKNTAKGAVSISFATFLLLIFWFSGLFGSGFKLVLQILRRDFSFNTDILFYLLYTFQLIFLGRYTGNFGFILPLFHFLPSTFFLFVFINSIYRYYIRGEVFWKGREIFIKRINR
uniref:Glycosyltransferase family 2 protein n=1 Tax=candidate division WOR-3 bacterium TaxID=2052148 RepID=A0A7C4Y3V8_UNCW3